jgi:steroid delta-isomerase-like uncharacterized protein
MKPSAENQDSESLKLTQYDPLEAHLTKYESVWKDILNKGEVDKFNEIYFDPRVTMITQFENIQGFESFKAYYNNFLIGFSDIQFTFHDAFGQGERIVGHWNFKGKHTGEFFGIPPTNKNVDISGVTLVHLKDGKIIQVQDFLDNLEFMRQLGIISR